MIVGGLLSKHWSNYSGKAGEFDMEQEVHGFPLGSTDRQGNFAGGLGRDMDEPRLFGWSDKG